MSTPQHHFTIRMNGKAVKVYAYMLNETPVFKCSTINETPIYITPVTNESRILFWYSLPDEKTEQASLVGRKIIEYIQSLEENVAIRSVRKYISIEGIQVPK